MVRRERNNKSPAQGSNARRGDSAAAVAAAGGTAKDILLALFDGVPCISAHGDPEQGKPRVAMMGNYPPPGDTEIMLLQIFYAF